MDTVVLLSHTHTVKQFHVNVAVLSQNNKTTWYEGEAHYTFVLHLGDMLYLDLQNGYLTFYRTATYLQSLVHLSFMTLDCERKQEHLVEISINSTETSDCRTIFHEVTGAI